MDTLSTICCAIVGGFVACTSILGIYTIVYDYRARQLANTAAAQKPVPKDEDEYDANLYTVATRAQAMMYVALNYNQVVMHIAARMNVKHVPEGVTHLKCDANTVSSLPALPSTLRSLICGSNSLTCLPELPNGLTELHCDHNRLKALPDLPITLEKLDCSYNEIQEIPSLPACLREFSCSDNLLQRLPTLSRNLQSLNCDNNQLKWLPALPENISSLKCGANYIQFLPDIPPNMYYVFCQMNPLEMLPSASHGSRLCIYTAGNLKLPEQDGNNYDIYFNRVMTQLAETRIALFKDELLCRAHQRNSDVNID